MRQRCFYFLVVCGTLFSGSLFGQQLAEKDTLAWHRWNVLTARFNPPSIFYRVHISDQVRLKLPINRFRLTNTDFEKMLAPVNSSGEPARPVRLILSSAPLAPGHYASRLGFFCKKELQMDRISPVPIRFRLGSADYVNYLEQKPNASWPR